MKKWFYKLPKTPEPEIVKETFLQLDTNKERALLQELRELQKTKLECPLSWHFDHHKEICGIEKEGLSRYYSEEQILDMLQDAINIKRKQIYIHQRIKEIKAELGIE